MSIEKPKSKKPGFSFDDTDNFNIPEIIDNKVVESNQQPSEQPKKRGRKPGTKLSKSYKFQLVPGAIETQLLITVPVELHEKIKKEADFYEVSVKEFLSKLIADRVGFEYKKNLIVISESDAVASVAKHPWTWNELEEKFKTHLVFHTLINTNPDWYGNLKNVSPELTSSITKEQWAKIATADYNAVKLIPAEHVNYVLKSIKESLNHQNNGEDNSNQQP